MEWHPLKSCNVVVVLSLCSLVAGRHCDYRNYWDSKSRMCRPCSKCPSNEIIRRPCSRRSNTVCGAFREFDYFNQLEDAKSSFTSYEYDAALEDGSRPGNGKKQYRQKAEGLPNEPIVEKDDGEYWRNLAFALIGMVCMLIFVATIVVLMACRKLHENSAIKRPEEEEDDDSGYVVIRAIRPPNAIYRPSASLTSAVTPSPAAVALLAQSDALPPRTLPPSLRHELRLKSTYKPKRRLLNYDADDVFESEDSSGSRSSRQAPLHPIPERSVSSDSESVSNQLAV